MSEKRKRALRIGVAGPVGSGKTTLVEWLSRALVAQGFEVAVVTNDIYTQEDADFLRAAATAAERVSGVETGGCPHSAIRDDASMNLEAIRELETMLPCWIWSSWKAAATTWPLPSARNSSISGSMSSMWRRATRFRARAARQHPLRPAGDQQDRPGALCRGVAGGHGARCHDCTRWPAIPFLQSTGRRRDHRTPGLDQTTHRRRAGAAAAGRRRANQLHAWRARGGTPTCQPQPLRDRWKSHHTGAKTRRNTKRAYCTG